jgi:hypothetical protein
MFDSTKPKYTKRVEQIWALKYMAIFLDLKEK